MPRVFTEIALVIKKIEFWQYVLLLISSIFIVCLTPFFTTAGSFLFVVLLTIGLASLVYFAHQLGELIEKRGLSEQPRGVPQMGEQRRDQEQERPDVPTKDILLSIPMPVPEDPGNKRPQDLQKQPRNPNLDSDLDGGVINSLMKIYMERNSLMQEEHAPFRDMGEQYRIAGLPPQRLDWLLREKAYTKLGLAGLRISFLDFTIQYKNLRGVKERQQRIETIGQGNSGNLREVLQLAHSYLLEHSQYLYDKQGGMLALKDALIAKRVEMQGRATHPTVPKAELLMAPIDTGGHFQLAAWLFEVGADNLVHARVVLTQSIHAPAWRDTAILQDLKEITHEAGIEVAEIFRFMYLQAGNTCADHTLMHADWIIQHLPATLPNERSLLEWIDDVTIPFATIPAAPAGRSGVGSLGLFSGEREVHRCLERHQVVDFSHNLRLKHFLVLANIPEAERRSRYVIGEIEFKKYQDDLFSPLPAPPAQPSLPSVVPCSRRPKPVINLSLIKRLRAAAALKQSTTPPVPNTFTPQLDTEKAIATGPSAKIGASDGDGVTTVPKSGVKANA